MLSENELNKLYRYALALTNQSEEAYDLVHSAVIKMQGRLILRKVAYAKTTIRHLFYEAKKKEPEELVDETPSIDTTLEDIAINSDQVKVILKELSPSERELLYLIAVEEYSFKEVANETGEKLGTLLSRFHRIKEKIKKGGLHEK